MTDAPFRIETLAASYGTLGAVLDLLSRHPPFAQYRLDRIAVAVRRQLDQGHNLAALAEDGRLFGYVGWAHALEASLENWVAGRGPLKLASRPTGAVALTVVISAGADCIPALIGEARRRNRGVRVYFKRTYGADLRVARKTSVANN